ncbi:MAG TPA: hypothetical protein VEW42_02890 [Candidatus Eisenbacteria bacterium]|nr:hypothetical protein [Candidatus Eisenbacteria bacterium]
MDPNVTSDEATPPVLPTQPSHSSSAMASSFSLGRMVLIGLGILGLGLAIAFGGYYLGQKNTPKQATLYPTPSATTSPTTTSSSATYTDAVFGVSFSYPSTWEVTHTEALPSYWLRISPKGYHANNDIGPILFAIGMTQDNQPIVLKNFLRGSSTSVTTPITMAGQLGYTQTLSSCEPFLCDIAAVTAHNNKAYILESFQFEQNPPDQRIVFQQILNTLQFIQ